MNEYGMKWLLGWIIRQRDDVRQTLERAKRYSETPEDKARIRFYEGLEAGYNEMKGCVEFLAEKEDEKEKCK